jgi:hypothetical protein
MLTHLLLSRFITSKYNLSLKSVTYKIKAALLSAYFILLERKNNDLLN